MRVSRLVSRIAAASLLATLVAPIPLARADDADAPGAALRHPGPLDDVRRELGALVSLSIESGRLRLDRVHWDRQLGHLTEDEVRQQVAADFAAKGIEGPRVERDVARLVKGPRVDLIFNRLKMAAGSNSFVGTPSEGDRNRVFLSRFISGELSFLGPAFVLDVIERGEPGRVVRLFDDGESLSLLLQHPRGDALVVTQGKRGRFSAMVVGEGGMHAASEASLALFYRRHRALLEREVGPIIAHFGIGVPPWPHAPRVRARVVALAAPLSDAERAEGAALLAALDAEGFEERERATVALTERYDRFASLIERALADEATSLEARGRLQRAVDAQPAPTEVERVIAGFGLLDDVDYLIELLDPQAGLAETERAGIAGRLAVITGKSIGPDADAWRRWRAEPEAPEAPPPEAESPKAPGPGEGG